MPPTDPFLDPVFTRDDARRAGMTKHQLDNRVATGAWRSLARGAYCLQSAWDQADLRDRQIMLGRAAIRTVRYPAWASHATAAALHDLPFPSRSPAWITRMPPASTRYSDHLTVEVATVPLRDQWFVAGLPTLSIARTAADGMRHFSPPDGLALIDATLRRYPHLMPEIGRVLEYSSDWPYAGRAALVLPHADRTRESPLESWSYWHMVRSDLPLPWCQVDLFDVLGTFLGRTDFWWDEFGVAGEADGRTKYDVLAGGSVEDAKRALIEEKEREDLFRRAGVRVARWGSRDLGRTRSWAHGLERFLREEPRRFRGFAVRRDGAA